MPAHACHVKILLIRLRLIGDVVFTTPLVGALKRTFPDSRLTYLVEREAAPVVAGNPNLADVIIISRTRGWARLRDDVALARRLRAQRFDVVLDLHGGPRSSWLTWATGAPQRIGYDIPGRGWQYTRKVHRPRGLQPRHSVANQWELLSAIDGWPGTAADPARNPTEMPLDAVADARVAERLRAAGVDERHDLAVVHVSAGNPFRRWPESSFAALVAGLAASDDRRRIVLSSGPSDRLAADRIADCGATRIGANPRGAGSRVWRRRPRGVTRAHRAERALCRRRHRPPAHRVDDEDTDRRYLRPDAGGTLRAVARSGHCHGSRAGHGPPLPAV